MSLEKGNLIVDGLAIVASSLAMLFFLIWADTPATVYVPLVEYREYPVEKVVVIEVPIPDYKSTLPLYEERPKIEKRVAEND